MAWLGKVSLGGFPDIAGTVAKLSESVKNIEKNFDSALGLEEKSDSGEASGIWPSASDRKALFDPVMAFMGHKGDDSATEVLEDAKSPEQPSSAEEHKSFSTEGSPVSTAERAGSLEENEDSDSKQKDGGDSHTANLTSIGPVRDSDSKQKDAGDSHTANITSIGPAEPDKDNGDSESNLSHASRALSITGDIQAAESVGVFQQKENEESEVSAEPESGRVKTTSSDFVEESERNIPHVPYEKYDINESQGSHDKQEIEGEHHLDEDLPVHPDMLVDRQVSLESESSGAIPINIQKHERTDEISDECTSNSSMSGQDPAKTSVVVHHDINESSEEVVVEAQGKDTEANDKELPVSNAPSSLHSADPAIEVEKVRKEMKFMEAALQGAARQSQSKADAIAKLMNENEQLKSVIEDLKRKSTEADIDVLRDEYYQRVSALERKVYALTKERDTLRREQSRKSDAAALLKEKDEIISQVMAEGEELSKKQAAQESTIRKLRAQIREFDEEKQRLISKLQVEETKVESIKRDKAATEKLLQETIEKNQAELAAQKEFYINALNVAKEAEALAESRANNEARVELEGRLREAGERESMLVQTLEELRQTLSRTEQQAVFREDMLRRDIEDLQKRYQASELRYNELITQVPDSTRPLLRQIEAMQESSARRQEAWAGVERALNSRLQEAEAKAAAAEERERAMNERLSQTLSRITVLETQNTCLRTEQKQLSRSLEKERQRASENRQEYLAAVEEAATQEGRAKQLDDEIKELRSKIKQELHESVTHRELLEKELERERAARLESEKNASRQTAAAATSPYAENGKPPLRSLSSTGSLSSMEESLFLQASLDSSESYFSERRIPGETTMSPYFLKSMTPSAFEAALRQKDGELASYISRLSSLESIRDSLAEELVKMTEQCEKLRTEAAVVPGLRAELEALRRRHSSALELMGERDEELEELRADIIDLKEMYREQVDLLVNRLQSSSVGAA